MGPHAGSHIFICRTTWHQIGTIFSPWMCSGTDQQIKRIYNGVCPQYLTSKCMLLNYAWLTLCRKYYTDKYNVSWSNINQQWLITNVFIHSGDILLLLVENNRSGFFPPMKQIWGNGTWESTWSIKVSHFLTHTQTLAQLASVCFLLVSSPPNHSCTSCLENMTPSPERVQDQGLPSCCVAH